MIVGEETDSALFTGDDKTSNIASWYLHCQTGITMSSNNAMYKGTVL